MAYLRTSVELGEEIHWKGNSNYHVLMIVGRRPDGNSLAREVTAREPITTTRNRKGFPVARRTPVLASAISVAGLISNHRIQPYPYPEQKVNVPSKEADWERDNSHWIKDLTNRHADPEILLEYIKEGVTEELMPIINDEWRNKLSFFIKSNSPEFNILLEVPRESEIVSQDYSC